MVKFLEKNRLHLPLVINLSHQKGGVGRSTLAYNIAEGFRTLGFRVKLLDMDIQNSCMGLNSLRKSAFEDIEKVLDEARLVEIINDSSLDEFEVLIIDTGGFDLALSRLAMAGADINLTPISDRVTELLGLVQKYSKILNATERDSRRSILSYILLNRIHPLATQFEHIEEMILANSQMKMIKSVVRERSIYDKSLIQGETVFEAKELKGHQTAVDEILSLCYELIEIYQNKR
ncbi:MAG: hypothetical protein DSZ11_00285 [Sulfurovum sp.]|nr:MAG: hypothetical protein DSZ11_00285 [Sulfurovum sp.]